MFITRFIKEYMPITFLLTIVAVLVFVVRIFFHDTVYPFFTVSKDAYGWLTYPLYHYNVFHLLGNLITLRLIGVYIEAAIGYKSYVLFLLLHTVFTGIFITLFNTDSVPVYGMSGFLIGNIYAFILFYPNSKINFLKVKYFSVVLVGVLVALTALSYEGLWVTNFMMHLGHLISLIVAMIIIPLIARK